MKIYPWHQSAFKKLTQMIKTKHLPHALLITGAKQMGKLELAQQLINTLLCGKKTCRGCQVCRAIEKDNPAEILQNNVLIRRSHYPNILYCRTELNNQGILSPEIKVGQIRAFCDALNKTADQLQIGLLFYADQMNINAANSLLKTLEEPRDNTLIILLAHNARNLPATILSRCQSVHIPPSYDHQTQNWLAEHMSKMQNLDFDVAQLLEIAHGVPYKALAELKNNNFISYQNWQNQLLNIAIHPSSISQTHDFDDNEAEILGCLQNLVIEGIKLKVMGKEGALVELNKVVQKTNTDFLFKLLDDISYSLSLLKTTVNTKLLLDNILIVWSHITHLKQYPEIAKH